MTNGQIESVLTETAASVATRLRSGDPGSPRRVGVRRLRGILPQSSHRRYHCSVEFEDGVSVELFAKKAPRIEYENMAGLRELEDRRVNVLVPRPLEYLEEVQYMLMEHIDGSPLMGRLVAECLRVSRQPAPETMQSLQLSAIGLAQLQSALGIVGEAYYDEEGLEKLVDELASTPYFNAAEIDAVGRRIRSDQPVLLQIPAVLSHGEFGPRNIIITDGPGVSLVDWPHQMTHNLAYDVGFFLHSLLGLARIFPWSRRKLEVLAGDFQATYLQQCELPIDPRWFEASRLANRIEILLRSHRRLSNARNRRVRLRAQRYVRYQKQRILTFLGKDQSGF